jgi:uncharacterized membrane protein YqjE
MSTDNGNPPTPPGLVQLVRRMGITVFSSLQNRAELLAVELREENLRVVELFIWGLAACFLGLMFLVVATFTVIMLFAPENRIYVGLVFCVLYLAGGIVALLNLKLLAKSASTPFSDSIDEIKKDAEWLESLK